MAYSWSNVTGSVPNGLSGIAQAGDLFNKAMGNFGNISKQQQQTIDANHANKVDNNTTDALAQLQAVRSNEGDVDALSATLMGQGYIDQGRVRTATENQRNTVHGLNRERDADERTRLNKLESDRRYEVGQWDKEEALALTNERYDKREARQDTMEVRADEAYAREQAAISKADGDAAANAGIAKGVSGMVAKNLEETNALADSYDGLTPGYMAGMYNIATGAIDANKINGFFGVRDDNRNTVEGKLAQQKAAKLTESIKSMMVTHRLRGQDAQSIIFDNPNTITDANTSLVNSLIPKNTPTVQEADALVTKEIAGNVAKEKLESGMAKAYDLTELNRSGVLSTDATKSIMETTGAGPAVMRGVNNILFNLNQAGLKLTSAEFGAITGAIPSADTLGTPNSNMEDTLSPILAAILKEAKDRPGASARVTELYDGYSKNGFWDYSTLGSGDVSGAETYKFKNPL